MKIRKGFVSNSSTSSFLIYGAEMDRDEVVKLLKDDNGEGDDCFGLYETLEKALEGTSLEQHNRDYSTYIGTSWSSVRDDETGKQFKERVESEMKKVFGDDVKCSTISEAWYNG